MPGPPKGGSPAGPSPRPPDPTPPPEEAPADFAGPGEVTLIDNLPAARRLSRYLRSRGRRYPVVVASRATGQSAAFPDTAELARELRGIAQVVEITRPNVAWELSSNLPADCQTYGGSSRVYPVGIDWLDRPQSLRLHLAYRMDERPVVTSRILSDALRQSAAQTYSSARPVAGSELVAGTVMGVRGGAAWVQLDNSQSQLDMAVIWPELVADEIPPERLFCKDMRVSGLMDPASRRIDVRPSRRLAAEALAGHQPGLTVPGRVVRVEPRSCRVELFPGQVVKLAAEDVAETPDLRFVLTVGETLPVLIVEREADGDQWLLSIKEAGEEVVPAPSLLPDGPPWLELSPPPEPAVAESQVAPWAGFDPGDLSKLVPADMDSATEIIGGLCRELVLAQQEAVKAGRERESARLELAGARTRQRASEQELAKTAAELAALRRGSLSGGETYFEDEAEQLDFEIRLAWAKRIPAAEKDRRPLADWSYSDHFFDTLRALQGIDRTKIVDVIVEVLTGLDAELRGRDLHQLRSGQGGDDPVRLGPNGETYWRVALQVGTASARRLHYMRRHDKGVELASVRLHDDLRT